MSVYALENFERFCLEMYYKNCDEREQYNEPRLTYDAYISGNRRWLLEKFSGESGWTLSLTPE